MEPWERQWAKQPATQGGQEPWEMDWSGDGGLPPPADEVIEEMHDDLTFGDRFAVKNFANDLQASINYLKKKHPGLEIQADDQGEIMVKKPEETAWRRLDPSGFDWQDLTDVTTDVGTGVAEGVAATAAGLAAAPTGPGAIAAAMGAGAGTGMALESLRQLAGQGLGVNDDFKGEDVLWSGAAGAASPLLFGTGASTKQIAKQALKKGMTAEAALNSQRGVLGKGLEKVAPKLGAIASGVPEDVIRHMREDPSLIGRIDDQGLMQYVEGVTGEITDTGLEKRSQLGKKVADVFSETRNLTKELEGLGPDRPFINNTAVRHRGLDPGEESTVGALLDTVQVDVTKVRGPFDQLVARLKETATRHPTEANQAKVQYVEGLIAEHFGNAQRLDGETAWSLKQDIDNIAQMYKVRGGTRPNLPKGAEKVEKEVIQAAKQASANARKELLRVADLASPGGGKTIDDAFKTYSNLMSQLDFLDQFTADPEKSYRNLNNLLNDSRRVRKQRVEGLDAELAGKTIDAAKDLAAYKAFTSSWLPVSSQGVTATLRGVPAGALGGVLGFAAGSNMGLGSGGGTAGGFAGAGLGVLAGGPRALRAYMAAGRKMRGLDKRVRDTGLKIQPQISPWLYMANRDNQESE